MKIKFRLYSLLIVLLLCLPLFASCHGSAGLSEFAIPAEFDMTRNYEISFWAKNDTNVNQMNIYKNAISDFEKIYPNIKVNLKAYTNYDTIYNDVITNIATKTTPNVCITYPDHIATYMTGSNTVIPFVTKNEIILFMIPTVVKRPLPKRISLYGSYSGLISEKTFSP